MSEFLVVSSTFARDPLLAVVLVAGLLIAFGALALRTHQMAFGPADGATAKLRATNLPSLAHLAIVLMAGVYIPGPVVAWFQHVARLLG